MTPAETTQMARAWMARANIKGPAAAALLGMPYPTWKKIMHEGRCAYPRMLQLAIERLERSECQCHGLNHALHRKA